MLTLGLAHGRRSMPTYRLKTASTLSGKFRAPLHPWRRRKFMNKFVVTAAVAGTLICGATLADGARTPTAQDPAQTQPAPSTGSPQTNSSPAQSPAARPASAQGARRVAPGSVIPVELTKTVDAKKARTGDEVVAKVTQDMKSESGEVLVPKDTKVIGHVTEVQARNKEQKQSQLAIAFDRAVTKDGNTMELPMSIQAVIGQQNSNPNGPAGNLPPATPSPGGGMPAGGSGGGGRTGSMSSPQSSNTAPPPAASAGTAAPDTGSDVPHPVINTQTQGVIGISNVTLSPAPGGARGSVMTSERSNVKLESGTILLLKVTE
jgi:Bacterial conjugation TrbI-like protein